MIKLFKQFNKKQVLMVLICFIIIIFQVGLELKLPDYMSEITKLIETEGSTMKEILTSGLYMLLCAFASAIFAVIIGFLASTLSAEFSLNLRERLFKKVQKFGITEIKNFQTSSLITRTTNDVTQIEMLIAFGLQALLRAPIMAIWAVTKIVNRSAALSGIVAVGVIILLITVFSIMFVVTPLFKKIQLLIDKTNNVTREGIQGVRVIRAFNAEKYQENKFNDVNSDLTNTNITIQKTFAIMDPVMGIIMHGLTVGIYFVGALLMVNLGLFQRLDLFSNMVVFTSYGMQVIMSFMMLTVIFMILPRARVSANRINEVLDSDIIIKDKDDAKPIEKGTVEFKNVSFKYPDADEYLLKNISFKAEEGETIAFIGSTGSGKSTLINLIPRFYDATDGTILVDGVDVKELKLDKLHDIVGYIPQKAFMFTGTIKSNISFGKRLKEEDIKDAIKISQAKEFVDKMDKNIDSHIARGGTNVSGGQKQRLSIARCLARRPEIIIFDDTFSALDYQTDLNLRQDLKKNLKDTTCLIVAQRIGTIIRADKIVVLDKGECVGIGTHKELLKSCEVYKEIALSQLSEEELNNA